MGGGSMVGMTLKKHSHSDPPTTAHLSSRLRMGSMNDQSGLALPTTLAFVVVTGVLIGTALLVGTMQRKLSSDSMRTVQAQYAASAGIEKAAQETFVKVLKNLKSGRTLIDYRKELDKIVLNGKKQEFEGTTLGKKESYKAIVEREDTANATILKITSRGWQMDKNTQYAASPKDATTRVLQQNLIIAPDQNIQGAAIFANEASCTACHTKVMDMNTFWTSSGGNTPSFLDGKPIAKVVVTGDLTLFQNGPFIPPASRSIDEADLTVAGTLYLGGLVRDQNLNMSPAPDLSSDRVVSFVERTGNSTLGRNVISPMATECAPDCPASGQSMYWHYPLGNSKAADGSFPASPPLPFADGNHNKTIEDAEWRSITASESGGTLSGGNNDIYPLSVWSDGTATNSGRTYKDSMGTDTAIMVYNSPTVAFSTKKPLKPAQIVNGVISGSVVLDGTKSPIDISGTVFVNGDVVIFGKTKGQGKIFARGNVYVMGDLEYDRSDYEKASTDKDFPMLTLAAGKNIILGDIFARAGAYNNPQELGQPNSVEPSYKSITAGIPDWLEAYGKLAPDTHGPYRDAEGNDLGQPPALWNARKNQFETDHKPLDVDTIMPRKATFCATMQGSVTSPNGLCNWPTVGTRTVRIRSVTGAEFGSFPFTFTPATPFACSIEENNVRRKASIPMGTPLEDIFCTVDTKAVQMNFAAAQLAKFNQIESLKKASDYMPIYYSLYAGDPPVQPVTQNETYLQYDINPDPLANPKGIFPLRDVVTQTSLSPTGGWLTASDLRKMWNQNMETTARRRAEDEMYPIRAKAFQIDAVLHAAHAVVGFTRGNSRIEATAANPEAKFVEWGGRSSTGGRVMIQGAVVAQDIGILAPGDARDGEKKDGTPRINRGRKSITKANTIRDDWYGLRVNYDARAAKLFVDPNTGVIKQLRRSGSRLVEFQ